MVNFNLITFLSQNAAGVGALGAIVGGSASAAKTFSAHRKGLMTRKAAIRETSNEAAGAGVATALSVVAAGAIGGGLILQLGTAVAAATAAKYAWDRSVDRVAHLRKRNSVAASDPSKTAD